MGAVGASWVALFVFSTARATTITVLGSDGVPLNGAYVKLYRVENGRRVVFDEGRTGPPNPDGVFAAKDLPTDADELSVFAWHGSESTFETINREGGKWKSDYTVQLEGRVERVIQPRVVPQPQRWVLVPQYRYFQDNYGRVFCERIYYWAPVVRGPVAVYSDVDPNPAFSVQPPALSPCVPCEPGAPAPRRFIYDDDALPSYQGLPPVHDPCWDAGPQ